MAVDQRVGVMVGVGITLIVAVIVFSFSGTILTQLRTTQVATADKTTVNTITPLCGGNSSTAFPDGSDTINCTLGQNVSLVNNNVVANTIFVVNATGGNTVPNQSFFVWRATGALELLNVTWNNTAVNVTYDHTTVTENVDFNASGDGLTAITNMSGFLPTIALVLIAGILIGVIVAVMGKRDELGV